MRITALIALLEAQLKQTGEADVLISDSHGNTCDIAHTEFLQRAYPVLVIHTE